MRPGQRESHQTVIKTGGLPRSGVVASLAGLGEPQRNVIRIGGFLEVGQMAAHAIRRRPLEFPADVVHAVALFTGRRKARCGMSGGAGPLIILGVAGIALGEQALERAYSCTFMARITFQRGVRSQQREAVLVLLNQRNLFKFSYRACSRTRLRAIPHKFVRSVERK